MFEVLHQDSSDDEEKPKRQTKHEQRADDKVKREATGDRAPKDNQHSKNVKGTEKNEKTTYSGEGKRDYDRRSGTGKDTFNKYEKKGGQGKANWGSENVEYEKKDNGTTEAKQVENDQPEEKVEEFVSLDDYMNANNVNLQMQQESGNQANDDFKVDKGMHVLKKKEDDFVSFEAKTKKNGEFKQQSNLIEAQEQENSYKRGGHAGRGGRGGRGGHGKSKNLGNDDFPALG